MNQIGNFPQMVGAIDAADNPPFSPVPVGGPTAADVLAANPPKPGNFAGAGVYGNTMVQGANQIATIYDEYKKEQRNRTKFKELLSKGERGATQYVKELREKCPGIDEYIPPMDFFRDAETGELDAVKYYDHAHRGYQEWRKDQAAAQAAETAKLKVETAQQQATPTPEETDLLKAKAEKLRQPPAPPKASGGKKTDEVTGRFFYTQTRSAVDKAIAARGMVSGVDEDIVKVQKELALIPPPAKKGTDIFASDRAQLESEIKRLTKERSKAEAAGEKVLSEAQRVQTEFETWKRNNPTSEVAKASQTLNVVDEVWNVLYPDKAATPPAAGPIGAPTAQPGPAAQPPAVGGSPIDKLISKAKSGDIKAQTYLHSKGIQW